MKLSICASMVFTAAWLCIAPHAEAADTAGRSAKLEELQEFCKTANCRYNLRVKLRRAKGAPYDSTFKVLPPAVQNSMITIHAGEKISAVPLFKGNSFLGWREVKADEAADTQIVTVDLSQSKNDTSMMAHVSTNTGPAIKLRMGLIRIDSDDKPEATSSCPLQAGGFSSFEMWPYPIFVLIVAEAKRLDDTDKMVCE
jgi:hypothetical protein